MSTPEPFPERPDWVVSFDDDDQTIYYNGRPVVALALSQEEIDLLEQAVTRLGDDPLAVQMRTRLELARADLQEKMR